MSSIPGTPHVPPPPGWYGDPEGRQRWWDGQRWTFAVADQPARPPDRTWAVLAHLSFLALPFVAPLAIRLTVGRDDPFVKHHSTEALNEHILYAILAVIGGCVSIVLVAMETADDSAAVPWGFFVAWLVMAAMGVYLLIVSIIGAVQAHHGIWWRYPVNLRLVRGGVRR